MNELEDQLNISFASGATAPDEFELSTAAPDLSISTGTFGNYNWNNTMIGPIGAITTGPYITSTSAGPYAISNGTIAGGAKLELKGENADIVINEVSLMNMLANIESRLNILHPNTNIEAEWDELRELGDRYRALEKQIKEKSDMWEKLKAMPPPTVD